MPDDALDPEALRDMELKRDQLDGVPDESAWAWTGPGPEPSWWRKPIAAMSADETADFHRTIGEALRDRRGVSVLIAQRDRVEGSDRV